MRRLSENQARTCEDAVGKVCRCRCGGALHGANRARKAHPEGEIPREWFEQLPPDDPHKVTTRGEKVPRPPRRKRGPTLPLPFDQEGA